MKYGKDVPFEDLKGKTLTSINTSGNVIMFLSDAGVTWKMYHHADCCEDVSIEDVCGDWNDLIDTPILLAEMDTSVTDPEGITKDHDIGDSFTWTFYKLSTIKGSLTIRWYGVSNGFYSEEVEFERVEER